MKFIKNIWRFMYMHPVWTTIIGMLLSSYITFVQSGDKYGGCFVFLLCYAALAPFLRNSRAREIKKQEYDYLARKTAEELAKHQENEKE